MDISTQLYTLYNMAFEWLIITDFRTVLHIFINKFYEFYEVKCRIDIKNVIIFFSHSIFPGNYFVCLFFRLGQNKSFIIRSMEGMERLKCQPEIN